MTVASEIPSTGLRVGWDSATITRTFRITNSPGVDADETISLHTAASHADIPSLGLFHPTLPYSATEIRADYVDPSSPFIVDVTVEYRQSNPTAGAIKFTEIQISPTITGVDIWKSGCSLPSNGTVTTSNEVITDGTPVSLTATGVTLNIIVGTVSITYEQTGLPGFTWLMNQAGSRNSGPFIGFNTGALLYMGPSVRRIGAVVGSFDNELGTFEVTHNFAFDDQLFCRQYIPLSSAVGGIPSKSDGSIHKLKWLQPYTKLVNFHHFGIQGIEGI